MPERLRCPDCGHIAEYHGGYQCLGAKDSRVGFYRPGIDERCECTMTDDEIREKAKAVTDTIGRPPKPLLNWNLMTDRNQEKVLTAQAERPHRRVGEWLKAPQIRDGALAALDRLMEREDARSVRLRDRFLSMRDEIEHGTTDRSVPPTELERLVDAFLALPLLEANRKVIEMAFHPGRRDMKLLSDPDAARRAFVLAARLYRGIYGQQGDVRLGEFCDELTAMHPELYDVPDNELDHNRRRG